MARMMTGAPAQKVTIAAAAAAMATMAVGILGKYLPEITSYETELVTLFVFLAGYLMPPAPADQVVDGATALKAQTA